MVFKGGNIEVNMKLVQFYRWIHSKYDLLIVEFIDQSIPDMTLIIVEFIDQSIPDMTY